MLCNERTERSAARCAWNEHYATSTALRAEMLLQLPTAQITVSELRKRPSETFRSRCDLRGGLLVLEARLLRGNSPDQHAEDRLRDNIRDLKSTEIEFQGTEHA